MRISIILFLFAFHLFVVSCTSEPDQITNIIGPEDWQGPELSWLSPPDAEVRGTVGLDIQITDSSAINRAALYLDGVSQNELASAPWRFELVTDSLEDGIHVAEVRAWDEHGNLGISPILRVNVMNSMAEGPRLLWVPDDFETIQSAINAAQDFDTIRVRDGVYYETLNLFGKGLWIESENGPMECGIDGGGGFAVFLIPSNSIPSTIRGFWLSSRGEMISVLAGAQVSILNNIFLSDSADGCIITSHFGGSIRNNLLSSSKNGVQIAYCLGDFYNNMITKIENVAFWNAAQYDNPLIYGYNLFWMNGIDYGDRFEPGIGDIYEDPLINLEGGYLEEGSPCIDAGTPEILDLDSTRSDIGPFGGPWAYK